MRANLTKLGLAAIVSAAALIGSVTAAGITGPVAPIPNPVFVAPLGCTNKFIGYGIAVDAVNTLKTTLAKGKVISWSYRYTGGGGRAWPTTAQGTVKTGTTALTVNLAPGQSVRIDLINKSYKVSECKASVVL
jgi:hypothetical protein